MGFTLSSSSAVTGDAIRMNGGQRNISVKNGVIAGNTIVTVSGTAPNQTWAVAVAGFNTGIYDFATPSATNCHFSQLPEFWTPGRRAGGRGTGHGNPQRALRWSLTPITEL